jgi:dihydroorotate dehydrogenase electron transfer subunit
VVRARIVVRVEPETEGIRTLYFKDELCSTAHPGQYVMIWVPGLGEVPMSLSTISREENSSFTVRNVGYATNALCSLEEGDKIGVRGPFGRGYIVAGTSPLIVAGGTGSVSLTPLAEEMVNMGIEPAFVLGARSSSQLVFRSRLSKLLGKSLILATDDGSLGFKGLASELAFNLLKERLFDHVYTCGPELMMVKTFNAAEEIGVPVQASLERYIKCAVGLCGSCAIGPIRVCKDGPVLNSEQLKVVHGEFGKWRMHSSGIKLKVDH